MQYVYKRVKIAMPHCPQCGEMLSGNGSLIMPYRCSCGIWESNWADPLEFTVVKPCACMSAGGMKDRQFNYHSETECRNDELGLLKA